MQLQDADLRARFEGAGQGHVFQAWERLDPAGRARLLAELAAVDLELVAELGRLIEAGPELAAQRIDPPEIFPLQRSPEQQRRAEEARACGELMLRDGRVGFLLVAGGQASRLGYEGPKGEFPIGPVSGRSLFALHARRLLATRERYGVEPVWYVMTSPANEAQTRASFERERAFGLDPRRVRLFSQAMLPALDLGGRLLMSGPDALFLAPNGHGGVLLALRESGALEDARRRGLEEFSYFQVDNPLARPADPLFLGLHALAGAQMSSKVVAKRDAAEKVGVLARMDGRLGCIEYSDLPAQLHEAREPDGQLRFRAGNIAVHAIRRDFIEELTRGRLQLPWHLARKTMQVFEDGQRVQRTGVKFETFVFDALGRARSSAVLEVERRLEFSPVKNASGDDSPHTARRDLCHLHGEWISAAGLPLPPPDENGVPPVEVDPLFAENLEEFLARAPHAPRRLEKGELYEHGAH
jgi:UDP-N-acetylglucosamine pyrophosphorylase